MKHLSIALACLLVFFAVISPASAEAALPAGLSVAVNVHEETGPAVIPDPDDPEIMHECFVRYPEFVSDDPALAPSLEKINRAILEKARIQDYVNLLPAFQMGSVGLRMNYRLTMTGFVDAEAKNIEGFDRYVSILFSAEGKMLRGRPGQIYYPMTFDLLTGEEVTFDQLFFDPEGAKAFIETYLEENVEPALSTYLENNQLFPVPFDRFWLDQLNHISILYEADQLSFLSGRSGAVSFRYCELEDYLDLTEDGILAHMPYRTFQSRIDDVQRQDNLLYLLSSGHLGLTDRSTYLLGSPLSWVLKEYPPAADPGYYPGGACYEPEDADYRGTLLLSDEEEKVYTGLLTSRFEYGDLKTGFTSLADAINLLGREPDAAYSVDADAAEMYLVCPGEAAEYRFDQADTPIVCTLYADENGTVQYIRQSINTD
ncbi:MAG: hypothetical protein K5919_04080 [Clostridiales bacterium]|nr:hypothetical protein [Clostridiales bacterium]